jgi:hypothetical protein
MAMRRKIPMPWRIYDLTNPQSVRVGSWLNDVMYIPSPMKPSQGLIHHVIWAN